MNTDRENPIMSLATQPNAKQMVFDYMTRNMKNWNTITLMQSVVSKEIGISRQHMNRVLKELVSKRFIINTGKLQNNNIYMINPNIVWCGMAEEHEAAIAKWTSILMGKE